MPLPDKDSAAAWGVPYSNARAVEDPTTDLDSDLFNQIATDVAMMTHTAVRAWVVFTGATYVGPGTDSLTPSDHDAVWGSSSAVRPTIGQTASGVYVATWAATQADELGESHTLNIRLPFAYAFGADGLRAKPISWTANTITINTFSAGSADALNGTKIAIWWF